MTDGVELLSPEQMASVESEVNRIYGLLDNPAIQHLIDTPALLQRTRKGRPIISLRQYEKMSESGMRMDEFDMQMANPTSTPPGQIHTIQASKLQKYRGSGYLPVEEFIAKQKTKEELKESLLASADKLRGRIMRYEDKEVELYFCNEQYPECTRFFDSAKGRQTHQGIDHKLQFKNAKVTRNKPTLEAKGI